MIEPPPGDGGPDEPDADESSVQPAEGPRHSVANSPGPRLTVADLGAMHGPDIEPAPAAEDVAASSQETPAAPAVPPGTDLARRLARAAALPPPEADEADVFEMRAPQRPGPLDRARRGVRWLFAPAGDRLDEPEAIEEDMPVAPVRPWLSEHARTDTPRTSPPMTVPPSLQREQEPEPEPELLPEPEPAPEPEPEPSAEAQPEAQRDAGPRPGEDLARRLADANMNALSNTLMGTSASVPTETPIESPDETDAEPEPRRRRPWQRPVPTPAERARRVEEPGTPVVAKTAQGAQTAQKAQKPAPAGQQPHGHPWRAFAIVLVLVVLGALGLRAYVISPYFIPTGSMEQTLHGCTGCNNDHVLVNRLSYHLHPVRRGDVVVFHRPTTWHTAEKLLIKRVIGLPGDTLTTVNGVVYVNGQELVEPYLNSECAAPVTTSLPRTVVPPHMVFVMGDNRCNSDDSRFFGPVPTSTIVGRAFIVIWPLKRLRWL